MSLAPAAADPTARERAGIIAEAASELHPRLEEWPGDDVDVAPLIEEFA